MIRYLAAAALLATPLAAQDTKPFDEVIDESIGYVNIGPGLLLVEDDESSRICQIRVNDGYFFGYAAGNQAAMDAAKPEVICVPTPIFVGNEATPAGDKNFADLIDDSIGYTTIGSGLILIEDDLSSNVCRVQADDAYFSAFAAGDASTAQAPMVVCVPTPTFVELSAVPADGRDFNTLVDESIGYVNVGDGMLLIEDDESSVICRVMVDDQYFKAYADANTDLMAEAAPVITCVGTPDFIE